MNFWRLTAKRIGYGLLLLVAVLVLNFILMSLAPGDIADTIAGEMGGANETMLAEIRASYGLDQPFHIQLWRYLSKVAVLDLGFSYFYNTPVITLILEKLPATLLLVFSAQILAITIGIILGVIAAKKPNGFFSLVVTLLSLFGFAAPVFWTGILLIILFVSIFPIFPIGGLMDVTLDGSWWQHVLDVLYHLTLPMITLASIFIALYSRLARASMLEVLGADYIRRITQSSLPAPSEHRSVTSV
ncbi:MAG: ABC transporter permease subunit [Gammaproteobacteria bacterium]|nr:ABC transporter permease subunit [Gammaproteobacteria bacterium]